MATQARKLVPGILVNMEILETKELPDQLWVYLCSSTHTI